MLKFFANPPLLIGENVAINFGNGQEATWVNLMEGMKIKDERIFLFFRTMKII